MERRTFASVRRRGPELEFRVASAQVGMDAYEGVSKIQKDDMVGIMLGDLQRVKFYAPLHGDFQVAQEVPEEVWEAFEFLTCDEVFALKPQYRANLLKR